MTQHKFDFQKLREDIIELSMISLPGLLFGGYAYWKKWFATQNCVGAWGEMDIQKGDGWLECTNYMKTYSIPEGFLLVVASIVVTVMFWYFTSQILSFGSSLIERYMICEEESEENLESSLNKNAEGDK